VFRLARDTIPDIQATVLWSETAAVRLAKAHKRYLGDSGTDYEKEAVAFTKLGYSGKNPSSTALPLPTDGSNVGSPQRFNWRWPHLHDSLL